MEETSTSISSRPKFIQTILSAHEDRQMWLKAKGKVVIRPTGTQTSDLPMTRTTRSTSWLTALSQLRQTCVDP